MLDRMRAAGYIRQAHDEEAAEFGRGWVAVLDDEEEWADTEGMAERKLNAMKVRRARTKIRAVE